MKNLARLTFGITVWILATFQSQAGCNRFVGSTMEVGGSPAAAWRTDYPATSTGSNKPWLQYHFDTEPQHYMKAVLSTIQPYFKSDGTRLVGTGSEPWWISEWMDYDVFGREPSMGLTEERGPLAGDLSPTSAKGSQVWAVNFYNELGASTFHQVFADPCNPTLASSTLFPEGTVAVKFLFTDGNLGVYNGQIDYLTGAPSYKALINTEGSGSTAILAQKRVSRALQLLQVDFSVKDSQASKTGWVFGTFAWMGPPKGDALFDNLVPVSLMWANDEGVNTDQIKESWINQQISGKLYGWASRPYLGFFGRANGPADNIRSSCLACHATAREPRSARPGSYADPSFSVQDFNDPMKVKAVVDVWFKNVAAGGTFDATFHPPAVATLDYSLQLNSAIDRMCRACADGALGGNTPAICLSANLYVHEATCKGVSLMSVNISQQSREDVLPPRQ